jgi:ATP-dependent exoDNAse (exonuclease V) beta subunit
VRKIFKHNFVPKFDIKSETIDGKRFYILPDGTTKVKSVTTIISDASDKTALLEWKKRVGEKEAQRITTQATRRGSSVHSIAERYVLNEEDYIKSENPFSLESFTHIKNVLDNSVNNILGVELPLFSKVLKTAGRTDLVAEYEGVPSIIDFKTSKKIKKEEWIENYFLQSTVYAMMFEAIYKIKIPQIAILITVDNEGIQKFIKPREEYVNKVIEIFTKNRR